METTLYLALGSIAGGFSRYYLGGFIYRLAGTRFPYGTMAVNLLGCFLVGVFAVLSEKKFLLGPQGRVLWMIGFCGAFTTFSTFMLETVYLIRDGQMLRAFFNVALSVILGFMALKLGMIVAEVL